MKRKVAILMMVVLMFTMAGCNKQTEPESVDVPSSEEFFQQITENQENN